MMIPTLEFKATASGSALKHVICEECRSEYFYVVERVGTGRGKSPLLLFNSSAASRAEAEAAAELNASLGRAIEFVPCPQCGRYQADMVRKARRCHKRWLFLAGATLAISVGTVGGLLVYLNQAGKVRGSLAPTPLFEICVGLVFALGIAMLMARRLIAKRYDPNAQNREERRRLGQSRAFARADLEKLIEANRPGQIQSGPIWISGLPSLPGSSG